MNDARGEVPIRVEFVRATRGGSADGQARPGQARPGQARLGRARPGQAGQVQEWRSLATGRIFEVRTEDSFGGPGELSVGTVGYLVFVDGAALVRRTPSGRWARPTTRRRPPPPIRPGTGMRRSGRPAPSGASTAKRGWLWFLALVAALLVVVIAALR